MVSCREILAGGLVLLALSACNTTKPMTVKRLTASSQDMPAINPADLEPIAFQRGIMGVRYGTAIAHFPGPGNFGSGLKLQGDLCNSEMKSPATLDWNSSSRELSGWGDQIGVVFYDVMSGRGFNLAGNPNQLFDADRDLRKARFAVGARIDEIAGNFCHEHDIWNGLPQFRYSGEMYMRVRWELYDVVQSKAVSSFESEGYFVHPNVTNNGIIETFMGAFSAATDALANIPEFSARLKKGASVTLEQVATPVGETMSIPKEPLKTDGFEKNAADLVRATVLIREGGGHGSGFFITKDGLIMTNAHVVGDAETVVVRLYNGVEIEGRVLRRHPERDIGLIKVPISFPQPMSLDVRDARIAERVFAIGAPLNTELQSTISSGVVSAVRQINSAGYRDIQADVDIHGGNSGGPLLDGAGNVIGVTYAGRYMQPGKVSSGLNLFIPIGQALESINLQLGPEAK